jgi:subtilisin
LDSVNPNIIYLDKVSIPYGIVNHLYQSSRLIGSNTNVKVGVIDTGIDPNHPYLNVVDGEAFFDSGYGNALPGLYMDNMSGHGTHVAGIIGSSHSDCMGMAPGIKLLSYRVFPDAEYWQSVGTKNIHIINAIRKAVASECDILNLSLGLSTPENSNVRDKDLEEACRYAYENGTLIVAAAGNNSESQVDLPARFIDVTQCVTAMGREGTVPVNTDAIQQLGLSARTDPLDRFAEFSNYCSRGTDVQFIAPGVGVISTIPGGGFGAMSGTSMACPVVSGIAANLLSHNPVVFSMDRNYRRTIAILDLLRNALHDHGFDTNYQGSGRPFI